MYLYTPPYDGQKNDRNMSHRNNNKRMYIVHVLSLCELDCYLSISLFPKNINMT